MKKPQDIKTGVQHVLGGEVVHDDKIRKHYGLIVLLVAFAGIYIYNGYQAQRQQHRVAALTKQIEEAHYEYLTISEQLVIQTRQSEVAKRLKELDSPLKVSNHPAILIK